MLWAFLYMRPCKSVWKILRGTYIEVEMLNYRRSATSSLQDNGEIGFYCDYTHQCLSLFYGKSIFIVRYSNFIDLMPIWGKIYFHFPDPWWGWVCFHILAIETFYSEIFLYMCLLFIFPLFAILTDLYDLFIIYILIWQF